MAAPKLCETCGTYHHEHQGHVFPRPSRSNPAPTVQLAKVERAINTAQRANPAINAPAINEGVSHVAKPKRSAGKESGASARSANRRKREDYNEYMRGYMARRRAARRVSGAAT